MEQIAEQPLVPLDGAEEVKERIRYQVVFILFFWGFKGREEQESFWLFSHVSLSCS